jgi:hypothetical protein
MGKERVAHQESLAQIYEPRQTRTSTFISLLSDFFGSAEFQGKFLRGKFIWRVLSNGIRRNPRPKGWAEYRVGVGPLRVRVKRSASKRAFRENIIAVYDRLRSKGLSRKTALAPRRDRERETRRVPAGPEITCLARFH